MLLMQLMSVILPLMSRVILPFHVEHRNRLNYRSMDSLKKIVARIERRLTAVDTNATAASRNAGLSPDAIRNLRRGAQGKIPVKGGNAGTFDALAPVLRSTVLWLTTGEGPESPDDDGHPKEKEQEPARGRRGAPKIISVPLLDQITAGKLKSPSSQIPVETVPLLAFADLGRGDFFALKVESDADSMDRISPPGSVVVVNKADRELRPGRCYIFSIDGETTYKMWQEGDPSYLAPYSTNPIHKPIFIKRKRDLEVIGRVKRTVLDL